MSLPRIAILSLGGTIGARVDAGGGNASLDIDARGLLAALPVLDSIASVTPQRFRQMMSADFTLADITALADAIAALSGEVDGVVVTQGTDTIEEVAFLLDLLVPPEMTVVVTGAMRNPGKPGEDGPANLVAAVRVAADPAAQGLGVLVVMDDSIHLARLVRKTHTFATGSFTSHPYGPVGSVVEDRVRIPLRPRHRLPRLLPAPGVPMPDVGLHTFVLDGSLTALEAVAGTGIGGLVVEAFGAGHVPARAVPLLERLARTVPVVLSSRSGSGELYRRSGSYPGSEGDLLARGLISAVALDGRKSRLLLMLLLASGADRTSIAAAFEAVST